MFHYPDFVLARSVNNRPPPKHYRNIDKENLTLLFYSVTKALECLSSPVLAPPVPSWTPVRPSLAEQPQRTQPRRRNDGPKWQRGRRRDRQQRQQRWPEGEREVTQYSHRDRAVFLLLKSIWLISPTEYIFLPFK